MNPRYPAVSARAGHRCEYCHAPEAVFNFPFEVEHITPPSRGGQDADENLALACRSCNIFKTDRVESSDPKTDDTVGLFHPRRDAWDDHFSVDVEAGAIDGRTAVGRATVTLLRMNATAQTTARLQWMRLELFP